MSYDPKVAKLVREFLSDHDKLWTEVDVVVISERIQKLLEEEIEETISEREIKQCQQWKQSDQTVYTVY